MLWLQSNYRMIIESILGGFLEITIATNVKDYR